MSALLGPALDALKAGLCVVPPRQDGSKAPEGFWRTWQVNRPDEATVRGWYANDRTGIGYVCGTVSGNLEMLEFEDIQTYTALVATAQALDLAELIERVSAGYETETPGGGIHWLYRCSEIAGNTKLACRPKRPEEQQHERNNIAVLIETRGQGGYTVEAPSNGSVHPSGGAYLLVRGGVDTIATISPDERRQLWDLARTFDQMPASMPNAEPMAGGRPIASSLIDDFNARTSWRDLLTTDGWALVYERGQVCYWRRPEKDRGVSAITGYNSEDRLAVYTTSTSLEAGRGHSKFAYMAHRDHSGDFRAAARVLAGRAPIHVLPSGSAPQSDPSEAGAITVCSEPWGEPSSVLGLPAAPTLDLTLLPAEIQRVTRDASERLQCPPDYLVWGLLTCTAGLIGRSVGIRPRQRDDWTERAAFWTVNIGDPSSLKSPSLEESRRSLRRQEAMDREHYEAELAAWEDRCDAIKADAKMRKEKNPKLPEEPVETRRATSDATIEKLADLMQNSPGLTLVRDEISGLVGSFNRYAKGEGDRQFYLEAYSGGAYTVDRIGRGTTRVSDLYLSILGGTQPDKARELFGEGPDDGFAARVNGIYPEMPREWREVDRYPDRAARAALDAVCDRLVSAPWAELLPCDEWKPLPYARLSPAAGELWSEWQTDLMRRLRAGEWEGRHAGRVGKYPGLAARLVLVFHLVDWAAGRVSADDVRLVPAQTLAAILDLMDQYVAPMDVRVYRAFDRSQAANGGERIARWIADGRSQSFTLREVRRHGWSGLSEPKNIEAAVEWLAAMGWVREADPEQRAGRPANRFEVNPRVWEVVDARAS